MGYFLQEYPFFIENSFSFPLSAILYLCNMKFLIIAAVIFGLYRYSNKRSSIGAQKNEVIDKEEDSDFTDYEEVD